MITPLWSMQEHETRARKRHITKQRHVPHYWIQEARCTGLETSLSADTSAYGMETWEAQARRKWGKGKREAGEQEVKREKGVEVDGEQRERRTTNNEGTISGRRGKQRAKRREDERKAGERGGGRRRLLGEGGEGDRCLGLRASRLQDTQLSPSAATTSQKASKTPLFPVACLRSLYYSNCHAVLVCPHIHRDSERRSPYSRTTYLPTSQRPHGSPVSAGVPFTLFGSLPEVKRPSSGRSDKITSSLGSNGDGDVSRA